MPPREPRLESDTTDNAFRDDLLTGPLDLRGQLSRNGALIAGPTGPGPGVTPDRDVIRRDTLHR